MSKLRLPIIKTNNKNTTNNIDITEYMLYFDGCSKGNPGPSGIGAVIYHNGIEIWSACKNIGDKRTNNESEYSALLFGLETAIEHNIEYLSVYGDSLLVINQINGIYKVKNENLYELYKIATDLQNKFTYITFKHVYRNENKRADYLSNIALTLAVDEHLVITNNF